MKKLTQITAMLVAVLVLTAAMAGCGTKDHDPNANPTDSGTVSGSDAVDDTRVTPIPSAFDPVNLEDCIFHVSFTNDDIELNDKGVLVLHMTVWEQELFDAADITGLKAGDTLVVRGEDIAVSSVENADGIIHVNGGVENGGISLSPSESGGTFCETNAEVAEYDVSYTSVAQLVLPVDADSFVYTDSSDLERGEKTYLADDLLTMKDDADFSCTAMNGTAHIVNNQVVEITRVYMP